MDRDTSTEERGRFGAWTEEFEQLREAVLGGAPAVEVERLAAAELEALAGERSW